MNLVSEIHSTGLFSCTAFLVVSLDEVF